MEELTSEDEKESNAAQGAAPEKELQSEAAEKEPESEKSEIEAVIIKPNATAETIAETYKTDETEVTANG